MIIDAQNTVSDAQALTATAVSTNTIDLGNVSPANDPGAGEPMCFHISVDVAADTADGNETYQFQLVQSANADLSSHDVLYQTDTTLITRSTLVAGYALILPVPPKLVTKRYIGIRYVLGGTSPTVTVTACLQPMSMVEDWKAYAKGYTIS